MNILYTIQDWLYGLTQREFYKMLALFFAALLVAVGVILYARYSYGLFFHKKLIRINKARTEARQFLQEHEFVLQQQREVNEILDKDPNFKIKEYFIQVAKELAIEKHMTKPAEVAEPQDLNNGYVEVKLEASLTEFNMKQLVDFLYKIEQNERIYTKELVINKSAKSPTIDITLVIATLQQQVS